MMARSKTVWVSADGLSFDTEQEAKDRDLVCEVADLLRSRAILHNSRANGDVASYMDAADALVMTDALHYVIDHIKKQQSNS